MIKKRISCFLSLTCTYRFTHSLIVPALLWVPSMFQMVLGDFNWSLPIFIRFRSFVLMKLSVAPESTSTCLSAVEDEDFNRVGICNDLYLLTNVLFSPSLECALAIGVARFKNPAWRSPPRLLSPR